MALNDIRLKVADFLNTKIIEENPFFLNLWHIVHFISGGIVMFFIMKLFRKEKGGIKFLILLTALLIYEIFELSFSIAESSLFRNETAKMHSGTLLLDF